MASNFFDKFDAEPASGGGNYFDKFDAPEPKSFTTAEAYDELRKQGAGPVKAGLLAGMARIGEALPQTGGFHAATREFPQAFERSLGGMLESPAALEASLRGVPLQDALSYRIGHAYATQSNAEPIDYSQEGPIATGVGKLAGFIGGATPAMMGAPLGPIGMGGAFAAQSSGQVIEDAVDRGATPEQALRAQAPAAIISGLAGAIGGQVGSNLMKAGAEKMIPTVAGRIADKALTGLALGAQQAPLMMASQAATNIAERETFNPEKPILENVAEQGVGALLATLGLHMAVGAGPVRASPVTVGELKSYANRLAEAAKKGEPPPEPPAGTVRASAEPARAMIPDPAWESVDMDGRPAWHNPTTGEVRYVKPMMAAPVEMAATAEHVPGGPLTEGPDIPKPLFDTTPEEMPPSDTSAQAERIAAIIRKPIAQMTNDELAIAANNTKGVISIRFKQALEKRQPEPVAAPAPEGPKLLPAPDVAMSDAQIADARAGMERPIGPRGEALAKAQMALDAAKASPVRGRKGRIQAALAEFDRVQREAETLSGPVRLPRDTGVIAMEKSPEPVQTMKPEVQTEAKPGPVVEPPAEPVAALIQKPRSRTVADREVTFDTEGDAALYDLGDRLARGERGPEINKAADAVLKNYEGIGVWRENAEGNFDTPRMTDRKHAIAAAKAFHDSVASDAKEGITKIQSPVDPEQAADYLRRGARESGAPAPRQGAPESMFQRNPDGSINAGNGVRLRQLDTKGEIFGIDVDPNDPAAKAISDILNKEYRRLFGRSAKKVNLQEIVTDKDGKTGGGAFFGEAGTGPVVAISMMLNGNVRPKLEMLKTLTHEGMHALRTAGVVSDTHLVVARKLAARNPEIAKWLEIYDKDVKRLGPVDGEKLLQNESLVELAARWLHGDKATRKALTGTVLDRLFRKLEALYRDVAMAIRGEKRLHGFAETIDDVFRKLERGEYSNAKSKDEPASMFRRDAESSKREQGDIERALPELGMTMADIRAKSGYTLGEKAIAMLNPRVIRSTVLSLKRQLATSRATWEAVQDVLEKMGAPTRTETDVVRAAGNAANRKIHDQIAIQENYVAPIVKMVRNYAASRGIDGDKAMTDVTVYATARQAKEVNDYVRNLTDGKNQAGSGMTDAQAAEALAAMRADGSEKAILPIWNKLRELHDQSMQKRVDAGLMTQESADNLRQMFPNKLPLRGFAEEAGADILEDVHATGSNTGPGFQIRGREFKAIGGRKEGSLAENVISHTVNYANEAAIRAEDQHVNQTVARLVNETPDPTFWEIKPAHTFETVHGKTRLTNRLTPEEVKRSVFFKENGVAKRIVFKDWRLAQELNGGPQRSTAIQNILAFHRPFLTMWKVLRTGLNPDFLLANPIRDVQDAFVTTAGMTNKKVGGKIVQHWFPAVKALSAHFRDMPESPEWKPWVKEFKEQGGYTSFMGRKDVDAITLELQQAIGDLLPAKTAMGKAGRAARHAYKPVLNAIEHANEVFENATRLSVYRAFRESGHDKASSAEAARRATVDFTDKGELAAGLDALWHFAPVNISGLRTTLRAVKSKRSQKIMGGIFGAGFLTGIWNQMMSDVAEDGESYYEKAARTNEEALSQSIPIMLPGLKAPVTIPAGRGVVGLPFTAGRLLAQTMFGNTKPGDAAANLAWTAAGTFMPIRSLVPTDAAPIVNIKSNTNDFGQPIHPEQPSYEAPSPNSQQAFKNTSIGFRKVAEGLNAATGGDKYTSGAVDLYPGNIQQVYDYFTGGVGTSIRRVSNLVAKIAGGDVEITGNDIPLARVFYKGQYPGADMQDFYERRQQAQVADLALKDMLKRGVSYAAAKEKLGDKFKYLTIHDEAESVARQLSDLRRERQRKEDAGASADVLRRLDEQAKAIVTRFNKKFNKLD